MVRVRTWMIETHTSNRGKQDIGVYEIRSGGAMWPKVETDEDD